MTMAVRQAALPAISIVTPSLNRAAFIEHAIGSVLAQDYPNLEHIVVDGGSTDNTMDVLALYPHLTVIHEPDRGIYDALNKGIRRARGDLIGHLNTDDTYALGAFHAIVERFNEDETLDSVGGRAELRDDRGIVRTISGARELSLTYENVLLGGPVINARFFRARIYAEIGSYDLAYPLTSDREFLIRCLIAGCRSAIIDQPVYVYRIHDGSMTFNAGQAAAAKLSEEYVEMATTWLNRPELPGDLTSAFRRLRGEAHARLAVLAFRDHRYVTALRHLSCRRGVPSLGPLIDIVRAGRSRTGRLS